MHEFESVLNKNKNKKKSHNSKWSQLTRERESPSPRNGFNEGWVEWRREEKIKSKSKYITNYGGKFVVPGSNISKLNTYKCITKEN